MQIPAELVPLVTSGVSILVGTRDASCVPACLRGAGASVSADRSRVTVYVPRQTGARTLSNVEDNGRVAITFSRIIDHRTVQVKGRCVARRDATEDDRAAQARYMEGFVTALEEVGFPRTATGRMAWWPSVALEIEIEAVFEQTPGPGAGRRIEETRA